MTSLPVLRNGERARFRVKGDLAALDATTRGAREAYRVALVSMPFISMLRPSIQLGLLKAIAETHGFPTTTYHLNLDFAREVTPEIHEGIANIGRCFLGDWLFASAAFGAEAPDPGGDFLRDYSLTSLLAEIKKPVEHLMHIRDHVVPRYLDRLLDEIPWGQFRAVGFTSTFQQSVASFALAARIRERHPEVTLIFGGANFDGEMGQELVKSIPVVDYAVVGEGDLAFPELLVALSEGGDPAAVPGVACRRGGAVVSPLPNPLFENLDDLPTPDYGEFFERAEALGLLPTGVRRDVYLPFESARGCWWGAKHHCTFCGLNNNGMAFRSKSPHRVREELSELSRRCRSFRFEAVDNILDTSYLSSLFTNLVEEGTDYEFFYEVKSNLTREHIRQLSAGGVRRIQPGIESLDSNVLRLMRKGVKAIQNVNTLRWAQHYGVRVGWNLLYGFPGETEEDYARQLALIRRLIHLEPPSGAGPIWMERFSPIFSDRESFPTHYVRPQIGYRYIFPRHVDLDSVAYFFDYEFTNALPSSAYEGTKQQVERWKDSWKRPTKPSLFFWSGSGFVIIEDLRDSEAPGSYTFEDPLASIYRACSDRPQTAEGVKAALNSPWPATEIESALDEFCKLGLMMREARSFLSLALPATRGR